MSASSSSLLAYSLFAGTFLLSVFSAHGDLDTLLRGDLSYSITLTPMVKSKLRLGMEYSGQFGEMYIATYPTYGN